MPGFPLRDESPALSQQFIILNQKEDKKRSAGHAVLPQTAALKINMGALMKKLSDQHNSHTLVGCLLMPLTPHAAIVRLTGPQAKRADGRKASLPGITAAPASSFLKSGKLGYHISRAPTSVSELSGSLRGFIRGASGIKSAFP